MGATKGVGDIFEEDMLRQIDERNSEITRRKGLEELKRVSEQEQTDVNSFNASAQQKELSKLELTDAVMCIKTLLSYGAKVTTSCNTTTVVLSNPDATESIDSQITAKEMYKGCKKIVHGGNLVRLQDYLMELTDAFNVTPGKLLQQYYEMLEVVRGAVKVLGMDEMQYLTYLQRILQGSVQLDGFTNTEIGTAMMSKRMLDTSEIFQMFTWSEVNCNAQVVNVNEVARNKVFTFCNKETDMWQLVRNNCPSDREPEEFLSDCMIGYAGITRDLVSMLREADRKYQPDKHVQAELVQRYKWEMKSMYLNRFMTDQSKQKELLFAALYQTLFEVDTSIVESVLTSEEMIAKKSEFIMKATRAQPRPSANITHEFT